MPAFKKGQAPWEQGGTETVKNEMHPDISFVDRLKVKALGNSDESSMKFLQRQYPNLDFRVQNGDIQARTKGEAWKKLDPSGFDLQDISDLAYDIPAGIAQGAVTAASGVAGLAAGGVGAIPAAMAGSAVSGAGLEAARQGLGKYFGVNDEINGTDIAIAGGTGAVSPLIFGTGGVVKEGVKGLSKEAAQLAQRGVVGRGYDAVAGYLGPKIASAASNIPEPVIKAAAKILPAIKAADKSPEPITAVLEENSKKVVKSLNKITNETRNEMSSAVKQMDDAGGAIETAQILAPINNLIQELESTGVQTEGRQEMVSELKNLVKKNFMIKSEVAPEMTPAQALAVKHGLEKAPAPVEQYVMPKVIKPSQAKEFYHTLKGLAQDTGANYNKSGSAQGIISAKNMSDKRVAAALTEATSNAQNSLKSLAENLDLPPVVSGNPLKPQEMQSVPFGQYYDDLHKKFSTAMDQKADFQRASTSDAAFQGLLSKAQTDATTEKLVLDLSRDTGVDLANIGTDINAIRMFRRPTGQAKSLQGATSTSTTLSRQIPLSAAAAAGGYYLGQQSGGEYSPYLSAVLAGAAGSRLASPAGIRSFMQMNRTMRAAPTAAIAEIPGFAAKTPVVNQLANTAVRPGIWLPQVLLDQSQNQ